MRARFLPPRSPTPSGGDGRRSAEVDQPPRSPAPGGDTRPGESGPQRPPLRGRPPMTPQVRFLRWAIPIGAVALAALLLLNNLVWQRWSEDELERGLTETLQRYSVAIETADCKRSGQFVRCTVATTTPGVPARFVVEGEIEALERVRWSHVDGDVEWDIPREVTLP